MNKKVSNIIFGILLVSFLIIAPLVVFYSLGWRFDWQELKFVQTGLFYFKAQPKGLAIYVNNEFKDRTDIFFGSSLIDNLIPGNYKIEIQKENYHNWSKNLEIKKGEATEASNITLIPAEINFDELLENVEDFFVSQSNNIVIVKEGEKDWSLKLYDTKNNLKSHIIDKEDFSKSNIVFYDLKISPNEEKVLLELGLKEKVQYFLLDISQSPTIINRLDFIGSPEEIIFHPRDNNKIYIIQSVTEKSKTFKTLNEVEIKEKEILAPLLKEVITCSIKSSIYCLNQEGYILESNGDEFKESNIISFPIKEEIKYQLIVFNSNFFLMEKDSLYFLDEITKSFKKLSDSIKGYRVSPDQKKLTYYTNNEIKVIYLEKQYEQPQKEKGGILFLTRFSEKINKVFWYNNHYLIFDLGDKIKVSELDNRDKLNIVTLTESPHQEILFTNGKLYLLSEGVLYSSNELI